jgi:hypothetical protein
MANRTRFIDEKVQSVEVAFGYINVEAVARETGIPASTLRYDLNKAKKALPDVLANRKPGPKPRNKPDKATASLSEKPAVCPECGGRVTKNGTYQVLNWLLMLTFGWLGIQRVRIQRRRCKECGCELISSERACQVKARKAWRNQVNRLVCLCRFKLRLSIRMIQILASFISRFTLFTNTSTKKDKFSYLSQNSRSVVGTLKLYLSYSHSLTHLQNSHSANLLK